MAPADPATGLLHVEVVWAEAPHAVRRVALTVPAGTTAAQALAASGLLDGTPGLAGVPMGIWGRACAPEAVLRDRDRVELYRDLQVDPKEARRLRVARHRPARR
jgi:putative ubiquitin-RnfH superfamily antitoxin RatB of RatAB toxin-antitoxin module